VDVTAAGRAGRRGEPSGLIALIYEREGLPRFELPLELHRLYGGDFSLPERSVYANFVSTIDGVIAIPGFRRSNRLISDDSEPDRFVVGLLRAFADVVLVGSGTLRGSPNARWQAQEAFPPAASSFAELRRLLGRAGEPEVAIVTGSGSIDTAHPALRGGALVLTTARGAATLEGQLADASQLVVLPGSDRVDARAVVDFLCSRGHERILSEAGPTLFGSLASAGLADELFLTVSPLLAGRSTLEPNLGLVEGASLLPSRRVGGQLLSARVHGSHLFLRYRLEHGS
jgi:riboflavin biosynthesis pyrimidine reductase